MAHRLSVFSSLFPPTKDDEPQIDPRASFFFFFDPSDPQYQNDLQRCRHSLLSVDSGYFNIMGKESPMFNSFSRNLSGGDLRLPFASVIDLTRESPKREGGIRNLLRKKKKSVSYDVDLSAICVPRPDGASPEPRDPSIDAFEERDRFVIRAGMKHHPYPRDDAPYMVAYNRTLLDNDRFSEILLRRLNLNHSPSFHDFFQPPKAILDLGCGSGTWAVQAAAFWPSSQVIGFDLLNPVRLRDNTISPSNVQWKQGNFVKYTLPFPDNTFDFVRMANLSLCVPYDRWKRVLSEVRRVLAQGGRLEFIDDHLYFPYTKRTPQPSEDSPSTPRASSSFSDDETEVDSDVESLDDDDDDNDDDDNNDDDFFSTKSHLSMFADMDDSPLPLPYDPIADWHRYVDNSKYLEKLFEDMLSRKFSVHPRPSKFFDDVIDDVFGRHNQCRLHEFNLYLAPPSSQDSDDFLTGNLEGHGSASFKKAGKDFAKWVTSVDRDHKEKDKRQRARGSDDSLPSRSTTPAGRFGTKLILPEPPHGLPAQSPGLILWPATFIRIAPFELEMHTCKHLHSLIGSKAALTEYLQDIAQEGDLRFDQKMVDDFVWEYESFRRRRFNWPSDCPDPDPRPEPFMTPPRSNTPRSFEQPSQSRARAGSASMVAPPTPLFPREKLDFVRSIRVYSATKNDEEIHVL